MLWSDVGLLGKGKTLSGVIWLYEAYCDGFTCYSNIWVDFPHIPIKEPIDFLKLNDGKALLDELWSIADNRKSMSALNDLTGIICARSRKRKFDIRYNQQTIKVDCRIVGITDKWVFPCVYPYDKSGKTRPTPNTLVDMIYNNGDLDNLAEKKVYRNIQPYLELYDTEKDAYTQKEMFSDEKMKKAYMKIQDLEGLNEENKKLRLSV